MKAKKILKVGGFLVVVLLVVAVLFVQFFLNATVKSVAQAVAPQITGTPFTVDDVDISVWTGRGSLRGVVIGNPEGFKTDSAISIGTIRVDVDLGSLPR